jgi:hypothetical protein
MNESPFVSRNNQLTDKYAEAMFSKVTFKKENTRQSLKNWLSTPQVCKEVKVSLQEMTFILCLLFINLLFRRDC